MMVIYLTVTFEVEWTKRFRVRVGKVNGNVDGQRDKKTDKRTELHQFRNRKRKC